MKGMNALFGFECLVRCFFDGCILLCVFVTAIEWAMNVFDFRVQAASFVELQSDRLYSAMQDSCSCLYAARDALP